jgi:hypothetical protein
LKSDQTVATRLADGVFLSRVRSTSPQEPPADNTIKN